MVVALLSFALVGWASLLAFRHSEGWSRWAVLVSCAGILAGSAVWACFYVRSQAVFAKADDAAVGVSPTGEVVFYSFAMQDLAACAALSCCMAAVPGLWAQEKHLQVPLRLWGMFACAACVPYAVLCLLPWS